MNPYRIYRDEWGRALAAQAEASSYSTFVAMPFQDTFSYRARGILSKVIARAARQADAARESKRPFAKPARVDRPMGAAVITEEIVLGILNSHFFIADVTFQNPGVLLEAGIALAIKPVRQIILITQGSPSELHFDLRGNNVLSYSPTGSVSKLAEALLAAARHFEEQLDYYAGSVVKRLSPDAIALLKWYGTIQRQHPGLSLHSGNMGPWLAGEGAHQRFEAATRELRDKDLLWTDYRPDATPTSDLHGTHATELGWVVIGKLWPSLRRASDTAGTEHSDTSTSAAPLAESSGTGAT